VTDYPRHYVAVADVHPDVLPRGRLVAFYNEKVDLVLDGQPLERAATHFFSA
jgi:hypothetical protein